MASNLSRFRHWAKKLVRRISVPERTEITIRTDRLLIIRRRVSRVWCETCGRNVDVVGLPEARVLTGTSHPILAGSAEPDGWHVCPGQDGEPRICVESLLK